MFLLLCSNLDEKIQIRLPRFEIPKKLRKQINSNDVDEILHEISQPITIQNYHSKWKLLLHVEEMQMETDIRRYDMSGVTMKHEGKLIYHK